jgi:hypothetical protein
MSWDLDMCWYFHYGINPKATIEDNSVLKPNTWSMCWIKLARFISFSNGLYNLILLNLILPKESSFIYLFLWLWEIFNVFLFFYFFIRLFICVYIVWVISPFCPLLPLSPPTPLTSRQYLFCPFLQFCWRVHISNNKKRQNVFASWDKDSYTERFLESLPFTSVFNLIIWFEKSFFCSLNEFSLISPTYTQIWKNGRDVGGREKNKTTSL